MVNETNWSPSDTDDAAQLSTFDSAAPAVFGFVLRRCASREIAEELTSATFVSALANRPGDAWPLPWLFAIARNKLIDHWRRAGRAEASDQRLQQRPAPQDGTEFAQVDDRLGVAAILQQLAPDHQMILVLRHIDDMTVPQCADHIERSVSATESLLRRAEAAFRTLWTNNSTGADQ